MDIKKTPLYPEILEYKLDKVDTLIDIGCQDGQFAKLIAHLYPDLHFVLEDLNEYLLCHKGGVKCNSHQTSFEIKRNLKNSKFAPNIENHYEFILGKMDSIPLKTASCKRVLCRKTLHEFDKLNKMVNELYRILEPNGILSITEVEAQYENHFDNMCNKQYLTKDEIVKIMHQFKFLGYKPIAYKEGNMNIYNFTK